MPLRDYQEHDLEAIRAEIRKGRRRVLYVSPTGSGKSYSTGFMAAGAIRRGLAVGYIAHRKELIDKCASDLRDLSIPCGVVMAGHRPEPGAMAQVMSIQTLIRRPLPQLGMVIVDEAHHAASDSYQKVIEAYPSAIIVGLTATPCRMDGRGLGDVFDSIVIGSTVRRLTEKGYLVPTRVFAPYKPQLKGVHTRGGDYVTSELGALLDKPKLVGDLVEHWAKLGAGRQTIAFAVDVKHSLHIVETFKAAGINAVHIDADTKKEDRESTLADLASGRVTIVSNVGILTEGFDCPAVSCIILARPTRSLSLYLQMVGRSLRPFPGKTDTLVLDHAGATLMHGFIAEERQWSLTQTRNSKRKEESPSVRICKVCFAAFSPNQYRRCPYCNAPYDTPKGVKFLDGDLVELDQKARVKLSQNPTTRRLQIIAAANGYKPGWVWVQMNLIREGKQPKSSPRAIARAAAWKAA